LILVPGERELTQVVPLIGKAKQVRLSAGEWDVLEGEDEKVVIVDAAYLEQHVPFVRDRLKRAGIRLGNLLNTTLGQ